MQPTKQCNGTVPVCLPHILYIVTSLQNFCFITCKTCRQGHNHAVLAAVAVSQV
jgi:hypothetical protein